MVDEVLISSFFSMKQFILIQRGGTLLPPLTQIPIPLVAEINLTQNPPLHS